MNNINKEEVREYLSILLGFLKRGALIVSIVGVIIYTGIFYIYKLVEFLIILIQGGFIERPDLLFSYWPFIFLFIGIFIFVGWKTKDVT